MHISIISKPVVARDKATFSTTDPSGVTVSSRVAGATARPLRIATSLEMSRYRVVVCFKRFQYLQLSYYLHPVAARK